jgi:hypothetical protein
VQDQQALRGQHVCEHASPEEDRDQPRIGVGRAVHDDRLPLAVERHIADPRVAKHPKNGIAPGLDRPVPEPIVAELGENPAPGRRLGAVAELSLQDPVVRYRALSVQRVRAHLASRQGDLRLHEETVDPVVRR